MSNLSENLKSAVKAIGKILFFPIRVVFLPVEVFLKWRDGPDGFQSGHDQKRARKRSKARKAPKDFLGGIGHYCRKIFNGSFRRLKQCNHPDLLLALLPLAMLAFLGFVFFQVYANADEIEARYRQGAQAAMDANDIPLAKTYLSRIVNEHELSDQDRLTWAMILSNTGESVRAQQVLEKLAPDNQLGYLPAHRVKAHGAGHQAGNETGYGNAAELADTAGIR